MAILFGYFLVQGVRGTFAYQAMVWNEPSPASAPTPAAKGSSLRWLWILGGLFALGCVALLSGLIYIGTAGPDIEVVPGAQVRKSFVSKIQALDLLEPDEKLLFFYSDALVDIENGFYLLTDRKVVVYRKDYAQPKVIVPITGIRDMDASWSDSFWEDSRITLTLADDSQVWFPLSRENGGDKAFFDTLKKNWEAQALPIEKE